MNFPIELENNSFITGKLSFDIYGNLYIDVTNNDITTYLIDSQNIKYPLVYQISVDNKNNPIADQGDYSIISDIEPKFGQLHIYNDGFSLRKKTLNTLDEEEKENNDCENDNKYYKEEQEYFENNDSYDNEDYIVNEDIYKQYGSDNKPFIFSSLDSTTKITIQDRINGDICSLYDTYIYKDNNLCFKSGSFDNSSLYRIKLHTDGKLYFRQIIEQDTEYKTILLKSGELIFKKIF